MDNYPIAPARSGQVDTQHSPADAPRESEECYRTLFESLDDGFCEIQILFDESGNANDWRYLEMNSAFAEHTAVPMEAVGTTAREAIPDLESRWFEIFGKVALTGETLRYVERSDALNRWFEGKAFRIGTPEQHRVAILFKDITLHKRAEDEARRHRDLLEQFISNAPIAFSMFDRNMRYISFSERWLQDTGIQSRDILGKSHYELFPNLPEHWKEVHRRALNGESIKADEEWVPGDGTTHSITWEIHPWGDAGADTGGVIISFADVTERKRAEQVLRHQAELLNLSFDAVIVWDFDHGIESWNLGAERLYGFAEKEVLGRVTHDVLQTAFPQPWSEILAVIRNKGSWEGELQHIACDGRKITVLARLQLIRDGGLERVLEINRDITERKQAEETIRKNEELLRTVTDQTGVGLVLLDTDRRYVFVNKAYCELLHLPDAEIVGKRVRDVLAAAYDQISPRLDRAFSGEHVTYELRMPGERCYTINYVPLRNDGLVTGMIVTVVDITQSKRSEEALRHSLERLERVLEVETVGVMFWDLSTGCMIDANDTFLRLMGYSRDDVEARRLTWQGLTPPEYMDVSRAEVEKFMATGRVGPYEKEYFCKDGTRRWLLFAGSSLGNNQCVEFCVDIADRMKTEQALRESEQRYRELSEQLEIRVRQRTAELQALNKELEAFSYSVSHDLRAPLRTLDGFSQALMANSKGLDEKGTHYLERIRAASQRMRSLIDGMLQLSRMTRAELEVTPVSLSEIAQEVINELRSSEPHRNVEVCIQSDLTVAGDARLLHAALENLLANAWKFTSKRENGVIEVGKLNNSPTPVFFVRDNGAGFDMDHAERLFTPFQRLHAESDFPGTGIGLATVQRIIARHQGRIWAESTPGNGATFYFELGTNEERRGSAA